MADQFNPEAQLPNSQDFLNYSRGFRDSSAGDFATGIAATADSGIKAIDRGVTQMANDEVDNVVNDADSQLLGIKNQGPAVDPLKAEIKQQVGNLADKKLAMDNGTIDPQHYYAYIQSNVKTIRTRYSGYNPEIDEELKRVGIDPNWQRKQIIEEGAKAANARASAANEYDKDQRELSEKFITDKDVIADPSLKAAVVNNQFAWRDPNVMKAIRGAYANTNALYSDWSAEKAQAELATAKGKVKSDALTNSYSSGLQLGLHKAVINSGSYQLVQSVAKSAQDEFAKTGTVSADTDAQLRQAYGQFRTGANTMRLGLKGQYTETAGLFQDGMKKADDEFDHQLDTLGDAITSKDYGALNIVVNGIAAYSNAAKADLLKDPATAAVAMIRETGGDAAVNAIALNNPTAVSDPYVKHIQTVQLSNQLAGKTAALNDTMKSLRAKGADGAALRDTIQKSIDLQLNPDVKDQGKLANARAMFSPANQPFWDNLDSNSRLTDADRRGYARQFASPEMSKEIDRLSQLDPRVKENYLNYTHYMFQKMNKDTASNINDTMKNSSDMTVTYDDTTNHLKVVPVIPQNRSVAGQMVDRATAMLRGNSADNAVQNFNTGVDTMTPIWKSYGLDPKTMSQGLAKELGINLVQPKNISPLTNYRGSNVAPAPTDNTPNPLDTSGAGSTLRDGENKGFTSGGNPALSLMPDKNNPTATPGQPYYAGLSGMGEVGQAVPQYASPAFAQALAAHSPEALDARQGLIKELNDLSAGYHKEGISPEVKAMYKEQMDQTMENLRTINKQSFNSPDGMEPGLTSPDATALNAITGSQDFIDAVKSGDPKEIAKQAALAMSSVIPFPGGKVGERALIEGGGKILGDATSFTAKSVEKSMAKDAVTNTTAASAVEHYSSDFAEQAAQKVAVNYTPAQLGKRIDQVKQFIQVSKDSIFIDAYNKELNTLLRAREIIKEGIKPVK